MLFSSIPGLEETKEKLIAAARNNHLAHALLFHGQEGSAGLQLALALATYANCERPGDRDACGACDSCSKMLKLIHPDVTFTFPVQSISGKEEEKEEEGKSNNVMVSWRAFVKDAPYGNLQDWIAHNRFTKQLNIAKAAGKTIIKTLSMHSFEGGYKIMLIWSPDLMHDATANALLKVLEEPPARTLFLLVANQPDKLLNTILSRTQKIPVRGFSDKEIMGHLVDTGRCSPEHAQQIAPLADGSMRAAYQLIEQVQDEHTSRFRDWMRICFTLDINEIVSFGELLGKQDKEAQKTLLLTGLNVLRESLLKKIQLDSLMRTSPSDRKFIEDFGTKVLTGDKILALYQLFNDAHYHLERNASARILFTALSFDAARVLRKKKPGMKVIIGRKEKISLSEWGFFNITAKVDTGAYTSSIHCEYVQVKELAGKRILEFLPLTPKNRHFKNNLISTEHFSLKKVKNSFGQVETRYRVSTKVAIFGREFQAEFTLSERSKMKNSILLGRKILKGRFLIDVDKIFLSAEKKPMK